MSSRRRAKVAVGLGSNLGDRLGHLRAAAGELRTFVAGLEWSSIYESEPEIVRDQPPFLNAACAGVTGLGPRALLARLQMLERAAGRKGGGRRYGPRVLDLDLLLYGDSVIEEPELVIPHPRLRDRAFVLIPLCEIAPDWEVPGVGKSERATVTDLAAAVSSEGVERTNLTFEGG